MTATFRADASRRRVVWSEIDGDALAFPIAIARGFRTLWTALLRRAQGGVGVGASASSGLLQRASGGGA